MVGGTRNPQRDPCRQSSPPCATFSHTPRSLQLATGRLQEHGPEPTMLMARSTAELSSCPLSAQDDSECPSGVPDLPQPPIPYSRFLPLFLLPQSPHPQLRQSFFCQRDPSHFLPGRVVWGMGYIPGIWHHHFSTNAKEGHPLSEGARHPQV